MSLRSRTFLVVAVAFLVAGGLLLLAVREATLRGFRQIEDQGAIRDTERAVSALDHDVHAVRSHALDYAEWDDAWLFCRGENPKYFGSGLTEATFKSQHIDAIAITDAADRLILAKSYDTEAEEFGDLPPTLASLGPGHAVVTASDGKEAVARAAEGGLDVILMDVRMPGLDGLEATRALRAAEKGRRVPVVALTASVMKEDTALCYEAGMDAILMKPVKSADLLRVVESLADSVAEPA